MPASSDERTKVDRDLDRDTIDAVLDLVSVSCRREVESSLSVEKPEISIQCKQELQTVLSGYDQQKPYDPVPELPQGLAAPFFVRHHTIIVGFFLLLSLLILFGRAFFTFRLFSPSTHENRTPSATKKAGGASKKKQSNNKPKSNKTK